MKKSYLLLLLPCFFGGFSLKASSGGLDHNSDEVLGHHSEDALEGHSQDVLEHHSEDSLEDHSQGVLEHHDEKYIKHHAQGSVGSKVVAAELNILLANHAVLLFQTLNYHWNVVGKEFHDYHLLFGKLYDALFKNMDVVAERIRSIQVEALGSMHAMSSEATLKEDTGKTPEPRQMIINLLDQYETLITHIHETIEMLEVKTKDFGTRKMLEDLIEQYEKTAWMLRSLSKK